MVFSEAEDVGLSKSSIKLPEEHLQTAGCGLAAASVSGPNGGRWHWALDN